MKYNIKKMPILKLITGSLIAQLISIAVSPLTTRIYSAEELGIYSLLISLITIMGPVVCLKLDMSIITAKDEKKMYANMLLATFTAIIVSIISTVVYTIYLEVSNNLGESTYIYVIFLFLILLLNGFINILISYNNRNREYDIISKVYVIRTFIQNMGLILFGILNFSVIGMLISQLLGNLIGVRKQAEKLIPNIKSLKEINKKDMVDAFKENYKLTIFTTPSTFLNSLSYSILNFFITELYGLETLGYYSISYRMLGIPISIITTNASKVFFERANTELQEKGNFKNILRQNTIALGSISIIMVICLFFLSPWAFQVFFGKNWRISGVYVQILSFMFGIRLLTASLTPAFIITKKQNLEISKQVLFLIVAILAYIVCKYFELKIYIFLIMISVLYSVIYIIMYMEIYKLAKNGGDKNEN